MKIKIFCCGVCLLVIISLMAGCSQSPQNKGQEVSQPGLQSVDSLPMGGSEQVLAGHEQSMQNTYTIQVVSYHEVSKAEGMVEKLKAEGYQAYISPEDLEKQGRWYRVRVGIYRSKEDAESQLPKLKEKFSDCFIRRR